MAEAGVGIFQIILDGRCMRGHGGSSVQQVRGKAEMETGTDTSKIEVF